MANGTHQSTIQEFSREFIGIPYYTFDCYDIVKLFYLKVFGISLLEYTYPDPLDRDNMNIIICSQKSKFKKISRPQFGDIVLLKVKDLACHLGIYINENKFIHTTKATGCIIDDFSVWKTKIDGYFRHG